MPSTRKRVSAPAEAPEPEDVEEELQEGMAGLQFNEALTWRAGRPIAVAELLRRLQALSQELRTMEQEDAERESLLPVAKDLASSNLLNHKDKGVRAWTACCVVDIFRLCAPDAPYTAAQLKDIFTLFITTIFPALADPSSPYNSQHLYVLKSLAEVKTIVLLTDIPAANSLIQHLFTCCFDVLSGPSKAHSGEELSKNVEHHMTAVLATLVDEAQGLPPEVIDVVLAQFLRADPRVIASKPKGKGAETQIDDRQLTLLMKEAPPAYNMAKNIGNSCPDKMARYVSHYFSSVIVDASSTTTAAAMNGTTKPKGRGRQSDTLVDDDEGPVIVSEEELHETRKAHRLLRELWRSTPSVLQDIIPQLELELSAEDLELRKLATETLGDMIAGIGAAGPPPAPTLNPAAFPSQSLTSSSERMTVYNFLTTPNSPHSFPSRHAQTYTQFINRKNDRSPIIRSAWTTGVGRILMTAAGGVGLDMEEEQQLLNFFADMLVDVDERVRLAAIKAIEQFSFHDIVQKLGSQGGVGDAGSILANLGDRVKDKKPNIRFEAMKLLSNIWGVGFGAIAEGSEQSSSLLGPIPSRILEVIYVNDPHTTVMVDRVLYESLLPLSYPPLKAKASGGSASQRTKELNADGDPESEAEIDKLRTERELVLIKSLEMKAKTALFHREGQGNTYVRFWATFLKACEDFNGGVMESNEAEIKKRLGGAIEYATKILPEPTRVSEDLWKFAKMHDRRNYQLIRFCMAPESDYRKVHKAIKELLKRIEDASSSSSTIKDTITPLLYRASMLLYNKSHVPSIIEFSRSDENGLGSTAHEVLKMISSQKPQVFKAHVEQLCRSLEAEAPTSKRPNAPTAVEDLKACAGFSRSFPEDVPKDRKFVQSMLGFAMYGTPPKAAKYGVSILMISSDKRDMHAREVAEKCTKGFKYGSDHFLAKLAALSQLVLVGSKYIDNDIDSIIDICINGVLLGAPSSPARGKSTADTKEEPIWTEDVDNDCAAKIWALKILVNRLRALGAQESVDEAAKPVYKLLSTLVSNEGELSKKTRTPPEHRSRLKLTAAQLLLKLSTAKKFDHLITPQNFNQLALVAHDPLPSVRSGFIKQLQKYLGNDRLPRRYYAIAFLLAFEPLSTLRESTLTWLKSRAAMFGKMKDTCMEALMARFLSLLAHHPDFDTEPENLKDTVNYILYYLKAVATAENISLIYYVVQRVKSVQDGIDASTSDNLYCLSDLAQAVIQRYADAYDWPLQAWPGKLRMPSGLFAALPNHDVAQEIATKSYVQESLVDQLEDIVKASIKSSKKRKADNTTAARQKRTKTNGTATSTKTGLARKTKVPKTPKSGRKSSAGAPSSDIRRSNRATGRKSYSEADSDEEGEEAADAGDDDAEMEDVSEEGSEVYEEEEEEEEEEAEAEPEPEPDLEEESEAEAPPPKSAERGKRKIVPAPAPVKKQAAPQKKTATPVRRSGRRAAEEET